jgi:hypothetical protein
MAKHLAIALIGATFLCSAALAQNTTLSSSSTGPTAVQTPQNPATQAPGASPMMGNQTQAGPSRLAPGSVIPVQLTKTIDAKKAKPGDEVLATVTQDLKANSGEVIVARDTKVIGHVTEAQARTKEQKESEVGITFDRTMSKSGETKLPMSIQAIIAPAPSNNSDNGGGNGEAGPATGGATATSPMGGGRNASVGGSAQSSAQPPAQSPNALPGEGNGQPAGNGRPRITGNTQGVIGIPNLKLEANAQNAAQGSVVTSEKGNVKLESGTLMLLRVSQ